MTHSAVAKAIEKKVPSVPKALASLTAMERELTTAKTYKEIKDIIREASALNVLLGHVAEVKARAEDTVLIASARIGEEIKKVPKATNSGRGQSTTKGKLGGKEATGIPGTSRARLSRLAEHREELKTIARDLRAEGDADGGRPLHHPGGQEEAPGSPRARACRQNHSAA